VTVFDRDPVAYEAVRPSYPDALVDDVVALAQLSPGAPVLEVGSGTGQATRLFLARGFAVTAVEAGPALAAATRRLGADVRVGRFEELALDELAIAGGWPLVYAATSWHWIDPARGYARARALLAGGGALALFWNEHVRGADDVGFFDATQDLYEAAGMGRERLKPSTQLHDRTAEIVASGDFGDVVRRQYPWHADYDARTYARLLGTYSDHLRLPDDVRGTLLDGIATLIEQKFGGRIRKHYVADLYVARAITRA